MKHVSFRIVVPLMVLLFISGCLQGKSPQGPQHLGAAPQVKESRTAAQPKAPPLTAFYDYLRSRRHLNQGQVTQGQTFLNMAIDKDPGSSFLKREKIRLLQQQKKYDQALEMAEALVKQAPDNVKNLVLLTRLKKGDDAEFIDLFRQILELDPNSKATYLRLGKIFMETERSEEALDLFRRMAERFPDYYVAHFYLGEAQMLTHKMNDAEVSFQKALALEPELVEPRLRLIDIYRSKNNEANKSNILSQYNKILGVEPENLRARLELALFHHKNKDTLKSEELFRQLGEALKNNSRLIMVAADAFITQKRYEDSIIVFTNLLKTVPDQKGLNFFLAISHEALNHYDKAIEHYLKVPPEHHQYKKALLSIAFLHREQGRTDEAIRFLEYHHRQNPEDIDMLSYLASFYGDEKRFEAAMNLLKDGLEQNPDNTGLMFKLGAIQDKAGLRADCIKSMKAILRTDPDHANALNYLGYTYAEMAIRLDEALAMVQRALKIKPGDGYITDSLGWVYFKKGEYDQAVAHLETAAKLSKYETVIADHLADAYMKNGQPNKAITMYKKALANAQRTQIDIVNAIKEKLKMIENKSDDKK